MSLVEGPFAHLQGEWIFQQLGSEGCRVSMSLEFEFSNRLVERTFGRVFSAAADKLVTSFSQRADELYG
jgi:ribosome-associated toxin RatA of RatAB toxin-antitoxin module